MQESQEKIVVAYVCDQSYIQYLKISMASVKRYNKNVEFAVLTSKAFDVPGAKVYTFTPDTARFKYRVNDRMKEGVYYKLYLPLLPYDKVLYMDADVICQRPLYPLWNEPCDYICGTESHRLGVRQAHQLGIPKYMLTGMMLMNLKALREDNFTQKCLDKLASITPDQHDETVINLAFTNKLRFIDKKFNYCRDRLYVAPIPESDAYLLHYVGKDKGDMLLRDNFSRVQVLKGILKGKRVAIVGNSSTILTKDQGAEIDAHDVVIRFNKGFPGPKVGFKTTLCFLACTLTPMELKKYTGAIFVRRSKLCHNICPYAISARDRVQLAQTPNGVRSRLHKQNSQASTGFIAINFALEADAGSIDLYGFDFFKTDTYYNPKGYQTLHNGDAEGDKVLEYAKYGLVTLH